MAEKDIFEKELESFNDVFADIVNVTMYDGEEVVEPEALSEQDPRGFCDGDKKRRELERDVMKSWEDGGIRLACFGFENQSEPDPDMPNRVICYDGIEYRAQIDRNKGRYPVITLVLYFNREKPWKGPLSLSAGFKVSERLKPFFNDYKINLIDIPSLTSEQVDRFKSDFKAVADFFVQWRETQNYVPKYHKLLHKKETIKMIDALGHTNFSVIFDYTDPEGVPDNMCEVVNMIQNRGIEIGRNEGIEIGRNEGIGIGRGEGIGIGEDNILSLMQRLIEQNRIDDIKHVTQDKEYRNKLLKEFHIC